VGGAVKDLAVTTLVYLAVTTLVYLAGGGEGVDHEHVGVGGLDGRGGVLMGGERGQGRVGWSRAGKVTWSRGHVRARSRGHVVTCGLGHVVSWSRAG
jgi:hypothetical protein